MSCQYCEELQASLQALLEALEDSESRVNHLVLADIQTARTLLAKLEEK